MNVFTTTTATSISRAFFAELAVDAWIDANRSWSAAAQQHDLVAACAAVRDSMFGGSTVADVRFGLDSVFGAVVREECVDLARVSAPRLAEVRLALLDAAEKMFRG